MTEPKVKPFPLPIPEMFKRGLRGYVANVVPLTLAAVATLAVYGAFGIPALQAFNDDDTVRFLALNIAGMVLASTTALPWFSYALNAARNEPIDVAAPFRDGTRFVDQLVASFWFWAAFLLGYQYLFTIPALFVAVLYAFFGFVVAERAAEGPLRSLGTSVRLGEKRRFALFSLLVLFFMFNFTALLPLGYGVNPVTAVIACITVTMTASITMVAWACLYDTLDDMLVPLPPAEKPQWGAIRKQRKSGKSKKPRRRR